MTAPLLINHFNKKGLTLDTEQQRVLAAMQLLLNQLVVFKKQRSSLLAKWLVRGAPPKGLYLWGGVGCGKTLMMDVFYEVLPLKRKRRIHFHALMQEIDEAFRQETYGEDPMKNIAQQIAKKTRVLCLDEMSITNISDAMMFSRLLHHALNLNIVIITTSNAHPNELYKNGLHRDRFLPAIDLLKLHLQVLQLNSGTDYRLQKIAGKSLWEYTDTTSNINTEDDKGDFLAKFYYDISQAKPKLAILNILGRKLPIKAMHGTTIWINFKELCGKGRTVDDYQELVMSYHTILLENIPYFSATNRDLAKRFIWLIDVLYDARVVLIASAETPILSLFANDINLSEVERIISRLLEMQSQSYQATGYRITRMQGTA